jgi:hypothetical protein
MKALDGHCPSRNCAKFVCRSGAMLGGCNNIFTTPDPPIREYYSSFDRVLLGRRKWWRPITIVLPNTKLVASSNPIGLLENFLIAITYYIM